MNTKAFAGTLAVALIACGCEMNDNNDRENRGTAPIGRERESNQVISRTAETMSQIEKRAAAVAHLNPTRGSDVQGTALFVPAPEGVRVVAEITGLSPGKHGFHVHEKGDCSAPDASSAGGHFNPTGAPHGAPTDPRHHVGDFGNITANQQGVARLDRVFPWLTLTGPQSILGKSVIVHAQPDDLQSQPSGSAGDRLACGVIGSK